MTLALVSALMLPISASVQEEKEATTPRLTRAEGGYLIELGPGAGEATLNLYQLVGAVAIATNRVFIWGEEADARLREQRVRLMGQKFVRTEQLPAFLQTMLLLGDLVSTEFVDGDAGIVGIESLPESSAEAREGAKATAGVGAVRDLGDRYLLAFQPGKTGQERSVFDFLSDCARVSGEQYTWDAPTEALLKGSPLGIQGTTLVPKDRLSDWVEITLSVSGFDSARFGEGDASVVRVTASPEGPEPASTPDMGEPVTLRFGSEGGAETLTLLELFQRCAESAGAQFTWTPATEALLKDTQICLLGSRSLQPSEVPRFLQRLLAASEFRCDVIGDEGITIIKVEPR